jgi:multidrug resistance efflux pump
VSGEIVKIHPEFTEGGFLKKDTRIIQIDPQDYELALARKRSAVTDAEYALKLELGHQQVAKREWDLLNQGKPAQDIEKELALRQPHLSKVRADLSATEAELKAAMLDLERTHITAPFNAMMLSESRYLYRWIVSNGSMFRFRLAILVPKPESFMARVMNAMGRLSG